MLNKVCKIHCALLVASFILTVRGVGAAIVIALSNDGFSPGGSLGGNFPSSLVFVGNVDGKSYFAESSIGRNWFEAGGYCNRYGMKLATITSASQAALLNESHSYGHFDGRYWTAGRDAQELRQFSWNDTGAPLSPDYLSLQVESRYDGVYSNCLQYFSTEGDSRLELWACSNDQRILCETLSA